MGIFGNQDSPWGGKEGWKSWRDRVPQRGKKLKERGWGTGKGSPRGLSGMGFAARLSALQALVLWAALGAAGKAWGLGQEPLREGRVRGVPRRGIQAALSPAHIGPAPDPEDWWSYKDNLQGNFVPGAARVGTQESVPLRASFLGPRNPLLPRSPSLSLLPSLRSPAQPQNPSGSPWDIIHAHFK